MRKPSIRIIVITLLTLGSGIYDLYSVMGPALPHRVRILHDIFPLEFRHLSRSLTLLLGFGLVISSLNIYKRKRRAFQGVALLSAASVAFNLTKGLDYEEAIWSAILLTLLFASRHLFTVRSSAPNLPQTLARLGLAGVMALGYGIAGFFYLDRRQFGIDFNLRDSILRTLRFLFWQGDPSIVPHTRFAQWFLDSLYLMTATAVSYAMFAIFRPALYRYRTLPHERELAAEIIRRNGRSALDYFKLWPDKSFYFSATHKSFIAYSVGKGVAIALGDPVGPDAEIEAAIRGFDAMCQENDWAVVFYQAQPDFISTYQRCGFHRLKIGDDAIVDLANFSLEGKAMKKVRSAYNQVEKGGATVQWFEPPIPDPVLLEAQQISEEWLRIPGRRERTFSLGAFDRDYIRRTQLFAIYDKNGRMIGFVNIIPSHRMGEATIDLMRHRTEGVPGIMDYLFVKLFQFEKERGFTRFNLGMAPMAGFQEHEEPSGTERAVHFLFQRLNFIFSFSGLRHYKAKYASFWEPRYAIYRSALELTRLAAALGKVSELED